MQLGEAGVRHMPCGELVSASKPQGLGSEKHPGRSLIGSSNKSHATLLISVESTKFSDKTQQPLCPGLRFSMD
jgi:hypothetical protein